jgi:hypothetical protein
MRAYLALALLLTLAPLSATARCLAQEPSVVSLEGELRASLLPGPPNYASIARGDYPESVLVLTLDSAICVSGDPSSSRNSQSHAGLLEVQLVVSKDQVRSLIGKRVRASGTLFAKHSEHHRTPIVLQVRSIRAL